MGRFRKDLSFGFKSLLRQPGFTLVAVLTLALGIGANAAVLSFALPMLFPVFPYYKDPDSLVILQRWRETTRPQTDPVLSYPVFADWKERNQVCLELAILMNTRRTLTGTEGNPERIDGLFVSGNVTKTLGIEPYMGRGFVPEDDARGADRTVMLSFELWQRRFGSDPEIINQKITLDGLTYAVIGILPPGLSSERLHKSLGSIWLPVNLFPDELDLDNRHRASSDYTPICRLRPGLSVSAAEEDMARITRGLAEDFPETDEEFRVEVVPIRDLESRRIRPMVLALLADVIFLLFIACANLVNLFLSRFLARQQEFAIRLALGVDRGGLIGLLVTEAFALALMASLLGLIAAYFVVRTLPPLLSSVPYAERAEISPGVFGYTILLCLVVTLVTGLIPALRTISPSWRRLLTPSLGSHSSPAHGGLRQGLIVSQFVLAFVLVTGTGLALASFLNMRGEERGFSPRQILSLDLELPLPKYADVAKWTTFYDRTLSVTAALPGVEAVALLNDPPAVRERGYRGPLFAGDRAIPPRGQRELCWYFIVSPGFFQELEIPLVEGRTFVRDDDLDSKWVVVVSRSVAEHFWPGESAVGRRFSFEGWGDINDPTLRWREIIGVVEDVRLRPLNEPPHHTVFIPYTQRPYYREGQPLPMMLLLKTAMDPTVLTETVRSEVLKLDPDQPVDNVRLLEEFITDDLSESRLVLVLFSLVAALALTLALAGIYGVTTYMIEARRGDIGIRIALGAGPSEIRAHLLRQDLVPILIGTVLGWIAAATSTRLASHWVSGVVYGVEPFAPVVYLWATVVLVTVAVLAAVVPAIRTIRFDPAHLLRNE